MRRIACALALLAVGACSNEPRGERLVFGDAITVAKATGVQAMAVDGRDIYFGVFDTGEVFKVDRRAPLTPKPVGSVPVRAKGANGLMGLAVHDHDLYVSYVNADRRLVVEELADRKRVYEGPVVNSLQRVGRIAFDPDGVLHVSLRDRIVRIVDGQADVVSQGWVNPLAFSIDERGRMFVADHPRRDGEAFVARGREANRAKRNRFATGLAGTKPSGLAFVRDEVLVCRSNVGDVARLHIGLDNVARRRGAVEGVRCRNAIVAMDDGSIVTALAHEIRRYPPA